MAVNRIRGAFTAPRKGETFELRAGLVYELPQIFEEIRTADSSMQFTICLRKVANAPPIPRSLNSRLIFIQEGVNTKDHHGHDTGQRCVSSLPRCAQEHSDLRLGPEEACISLSDVGLCLLNDVFS
jgi:hypothetical protein